ncbi:hypothetical protein F5X99DRAFT_342470 [Biscogniauxia marginata]|nr:hypothetical protein F5X99DRAFT_342470 [Biscogniauxia marginata]
MTSQNSTITCLSSENHKHQIKEHLLHYLGCLEFCDRERFFHVDNSLWKDEIDHQIALGRTQQDANDLVQEKRIAWKTNCESELRRIDFLRKTLSKDLSEHHLVDKLEESRLEWRNSEECEANIQKARRSHVGHKQRNVLPPDVSSRVDEAYEPEKDVNVPIMLFENGKGVNDGDKEDKRVWGTFPSQKTTVANLFDGESDKNLKNSLLHKDRYSGEDGCTDRIRYYHLPANNMKWVEETISRYFGDKRPDYEGTHRELQRLKKTKTYMVLRGPYWRSQLHGYDSQQTPPHARHMRPLCTTVSSSTDEADYLPKNMVLFMPYFHWDTSRKRGQFAAEINSIMAPAKKNESLNGLVPVTNPKIDANGRVQVKNALGRYLLDAARLYEGMANYRDKLLLRKYLNQDPPMHPRRTLDQAFYWTLNSTRQRDRDQVVYRGTTTLPEDFHSFNRETKKWTHHEAFGIQGPCDECKSNIQKVSRVVMVDQLWMWILDEKTVITCFPKRYGANKHDSSGVHKSIRLRLQDNSPDQIRTVFDLALIIIDECSNTFFDRTKTMDKQPQVIDTFSKAIGNVMHKQTAAFERLWRWTDKAGDIYRSRSDDDTSDLHVPLLDINPEGKLEREIKDIIEELDIMLHITKTHRDILKSFVVNAEHILDPFGTFGQESKRPMTSQNLWMISRRNEERISSPASGRDHDYGLEDHKRREDYHWFKTNADERYASVVDRIEELEELRSSAMNTADSVKDLLELKQQQASVVQAWQSVKQSEESIKQGRSIMMFTLVTIVFLPLSFLSSIFGMNNLEFSDNSWHIRDELRLMFTISAGVILLSLIFAFSAWIRAGIWYGYKCLGTTFVVRTGLYDLWLDMGLPSKKIHHSAAVFANQLKEKQRKARFERRRAERAKKDRSSARANGNSSGDQISTASTRLASNESNNVSAAETRNGDARPAWSTREILVSCVTNRLWSRGDRSDVEAGNASAQ